jgi:excinuclease ABC subunit A
MPLVTADDVASALLARHRADASDSARDAIIVRRARTNNLRDVSVSIPHAALTVITGVSGSGKSSLAFDTQFAEGRRRFVQSLSTYARQFLEKLARPDVDEILNLPPAIALEQSNPVKNARSTVGTATELNDYLRLMYARVSDVVCPDCERPVVARTPSGLAEELAALGEGARIVITAPVNLAHADLAGSMAASLGMMGFDRLWRDGGVEDMAELGDAGLRRLATWDVVIDRLILRGAAADDSGADRESVDIDNDQRARLSTAIDTAFRVGRNELTVHRPDVIAAAERAGRTPPEEEVEGAATTYFAGLRCEGCGRNFHAPEPELFSFYSALGACKRCEGYGRVIGIDWNKVFPEPQLSIRDGAISPWRTPAWQDLQRECVRFCRQHDIPVDTPWMELTTAQQKLVREGSAGFPGVRGFFKYLEGERRKVQSRILLARYRSYETCPDCEGSRLVGEVKAYRVAGRTIHEFATMPIRDLRRWFDEFDFEEPAKRKTAERLLEELRSRLHYLDEVGLGYLTLDRQTRSLSGGESQRINLATALGSALTETLYVLDEPTVGLHARDTRRLLDIMRGLRANGNTVVVVEHDKEMIRGADHLIDIGPHAGEQGGRLLYEGSVAALEREGSTLTAEYLRRDESLRPKSTSEARKPTGFIGIRGAREHNLVGIDAEVPLGVLCCVTGVSGSGKSTLIHDILYLGWRRATQGATEQPGLHRALTNAKSIETMTFVDQTPIGRSARSNPVTYTGAWNQIRALLASTGEAKRLGIEPRDFSFNVRGGRCETCEGTGSVAIDLHFLGEVSVVCDACGGRRFKDHVLGVRYRGKNVHDILSLTIAEAMVFLKDEGTCREALRPLIDVGLGYLRLGQSTSTLSGGELQRLKLASYLGDKVGGQGKMLIFDEPSTGLHAADIDQLVTVFERLVDLGYSIVVIEHNLDVIARADWLIDLGPEGGDGGGRLLYSGPPAPLAKVAESWTGRFFRP